MQAIFSAIFIALGGMAVIAWRSRRHASTGDFDCALRPAGGKRWEHGQARIAPGELSFRRTATRGGVRLGKRPTAPRQIGVSTVSASGERPTSRESWGVNPRAMIFHLTTTEGPLDWAVVAPDPDAVASALRGERG